MRKKSNVGTWLGKMLPKQEKVLDDKVYNACNAALVRNAVRYGIKQNGSLSKEEKSRMVSELDEEFGKYFKEDSAEGYKEFMEKYDPSLLQKVGKELSSAKTKIVKAYDDLTK